MKSVTLEEENEQNVIDLFFLSLLSYLKAQYSTTLYQKVLRKYCQLMLKTEVMSGPERDLLRLSLLWGEKEVKNWCPLLCLSVPSASYITTVHWEQWIDGNKGIIPRTTYILWAGDMHCELESSQFLVLFITWKNSLVPTQITPENRNLIWLKLSDSMTY